MKQVRFEAVMVIGAVMIALAFAGTPAEAGGMKGVYRFVVSDVRAYDVSPDIITYCSGFGTLTFNATGTANVVSEDRCIVPGFPPDPPQTNSSVFTYTVDSDGTVILTETNGDLSTTHCRLADSGKMLLCDASGKNDSVLQWHAIAVMK